jgi:ParB family chromosome partitioning protein
MRGKAQAPEYPSPRPSPARGEGERKATSETPMFQEKYFTYRGNVRALAPAGKFLAFVTEHPEGQAMALCRLNPDKLSLESDPLPAGGLALLTVGDTLYIAGTDKRLYRIPVKGGKPEAFGPELDGKPAALASLSGERIAVAVGNGIVVVSTTEGEQTQKLDVKEKITCLAADPTGQWLAAGTDKGSVAVFECESDPSTFRLSDQQRLHEAAVTALLFEAEELRFFSAGADQKLLSTHARGRLEAEDRGRGFNHEEPITALVWGVKGRFLSGSGDKTLKAWPKGKGTQPVTLKENITGKVVALAVIPVQGEPNVVAACDDDTLRFWALDDEGKFGEMRAVIHGVDDWAKRQLSISDAKQREAVLQTLAGYADGESIKRIYNQMDRDPDHALRLLCCQLLAESKHPKAPKALEKALEHKDEAVRRAAFAGLRAAAGPTDIRPLTLALRVEKPDVGVLAVQALAELARKDDQARAKLTDALEAKTREIRWAALDGLEKVTGAQSPEPSLLALKSTHADVRRLALLRLHKRKLLADARVQGVLRWRGEDQDAEVRRVAFLLSLYTRDKLLAALRARDPELERQLTELESGSLEAEAPAGGAKS